MAVEPPREGLVIMLAPPSGEGQTSRRVRNDRWQGAGYKSWPLGAPYGEHGPRLRALVPNQIFLTRVARFRVSGWVVSGQLVNDFSEVHGKEFFLLLRELWKQETRQPNDILVAVPKLITGLMQFQDSPQRLPKARR